MSLDNNIIKFFVCGQVDSGKSTLIGHLLYLTSAIRKLDTSSKESTKFSDLLDFDESERERGITQSSCNFEFIYTLDDKIYELLAIDTPGHLLYIRELINSISLNKVSVGCIIISSVKSEFDSMFNSGTTKEDVILMRCCGINHVIVCVNKVDKLNNENIYENLQYVKNTFDSWISKLGFKSVTYIYISGYQGYNLIDRYDELDMYINKEDNKTFMETLIDVNSKINRIDRIKIEKIKDKCKLEFRSFDIPKIIAKGFQGVFHIVEPDDEKNSEIIGEICKICFNQKEKTFFRSNENVFLFIKLEKEIKIFERQRFILRSDNNTIGFGYVTFK